MCTCISYSIIYGSHSTNTITTTTKKLNHLTTTTTINTNNHSLAIFPLTALPHYHHHTHSLAIILFSLPTALPTQGPSSSGVRLHQARTMLDRAAAVLDRLDRRLQVAPSTDSTPDNEKTPGTSQVSQDGDGTFTKCSNFYLYLFISCIKEFYKVGLSD